MASAFIPARVIENHQWAENLFSIRLAIQLQPFQAGQFVRLQVDVNGEKMAKPYSLVNAPHQENAEVFYNIVKDGPMSNALAALRKDDIIEISQPAAGFFVLEEVPDTANLWMMATGTGLGPYLSILQENLVWQRFDQIVVVHAVSYASNLAYQPLIETLRNQSPQKLHYVPVVSRETHPGALKGRIPALIKEGLLEEATGLSLNAENSHVMLCGNQHMITDTKAVLAERNMRKHLRRKPGHITTEQYF